MISNKQFYQKQDHLKVSLIIFLKDLRVQLYCLSIIIWLHLKLKSNQFLMRLQAKMKILVLANTTLTNLNFFDAQHLSLLPNQTLADLDFLIQLILIFQMLVSTM